MGGKLRGQYLSLTNFYLTVSSASLTSGSSWSAWLRKLSWILQRFPTGLFSLGTLIWSMCLYSNLYGLLWLFSHPLGAGEHISSVWAFRANSLGVIQENPTLALSPVTHICSMGNIHILALPDSRRIVWSSGIRQQSFLSPDQETELTDLTVIFMKIPSPHLH